MNKFTKKQLVCLTEIYRRLNCLHNGNLHEKLMVLGYPGEMKPIRDLGLIQPYGSETRRIVGWYSLTERGKRFFSKYVEEVNDDDNAAMFEGRMIKTFSIDLYLSS